MFFSVNVLFYFDFCLCITQNCDDGNSDFDNQRIIRMNSNRPADENVVPDVQTKPNRQKKSPEADSSARGTSSVEQAANSGEKGIKPEKKKVEVKDGSRLFRYKVVSLQVATSRFAATRSRFATHKVDSLHIFGRFASNSRNPKVDSLHKPIV